VDLTSDEEEQDSIGADDEEARNEERQEASQVVSDPALRCICRNNRAIFLSRSHTNNEACGQSPAKDVIVLLEELRFAVAAHDHLVEVEGDAEGPAKVGYKEKVY